MSRLSGWCGQRGIPNHKGCRVPEECGCICHDASVTAGTISPQGHDYASRPPSSGAPTPLRGLADRKDTTDS